MQVLVVDDTEPVRQRMAAIFGTIPGVDRVTESGDGRDALAQIELGIPDVLVLDIAMPVLDGLRVLDALAARQWRVPVIVVSNRDEYREEALRRGAAFFFDKTTQMNSLVATLALMAAAWKPR